MLESIFVFLKYPELADDLEEYDCKNPTPYENLRDRTVGMTSVELKKEWFSEIKEYKQYIQQYTNIKLSPGQSDHQMLNNIISTWKETLRTTRFCGYNDIKSFYERYREYDKVRNAKCRICSVCGSRTRTYKKKLQDCVQFLSLLEVEQEEVRDYEALVQHQNDRIGRLAQLVFHIEKVGLKYFHFLDLDEEKYYTECNDPKRVSNFSLLHNDKVKKLPACDECATKLKKRSKWAEKHPDDVLNIDSGPQLP